MEMEALTGVQVTLLTIYDMCKAIDKHMVMSNIHLLKRRVVRVEIFIFDITNYSAICKILLGK